MTLTAHGASLHTAKIATLGEPGLRRVYGDWSSAALSGWKKKARDLGLVVGTVVVAIMHALPFGKKDTKDTHNAAG